VPLAKLAQEANLARLANPARMELQATVAPLEMLVPLADPAKPVHLVPAESQARTAHLAAANTAHQLVWLQVIKRQRSPSQVMRPNATSTGPHCRRKRISYRPKFILSCRFSTF